MDSGEHDDAPREREREHEILEAASEEFATHGFRGATIQGIARRARLASQALIYWYLPIKEALFVALLGGVPKPQAGVVQGALLVPAPMARVWLLRVVYLWC